MEFYYAHPWKNVWIREKKFQRIFSTYESVLTEKIQIHDSNHSFSDLWFSSFFLWICVQLVLIFGSEKTYRSRIFLRITQLRWPLKTMIEFGMRFPAHRETRKSPLQFACLQYEFLKRTKNRICIMNTLEKCRTNFIYRLFLRLIERFWLCRGIWHPH